MPTPNGPKWTLALLPIAIGLALSFVVCVTQWMQGEHAKLLLIGLDGMCFYMAIGITVLLVAITAIIRFRPKAVSLALTACLIAFLSFVTSKLIRVDGHYGNRTPRVTWSWTPKAEFQMKTYLASRSINEPKPNLEFDFSTTDMDFPELLGKSRAGTVDGVEILTNWNELPPKLLWRHPVGLGWSSFSIVGNVAVDLEQREEQECVVCYDVRTGVELWCHRETTRFLHEYGDGPRSTPTIRDGRVFSMGATGILTCVDFKTGSLIWKQSVFSEAAENLIFGMTGSPLILDDLVIVTPGAGKGGAAIAFACDTGNERWRAGDDQASYASPVAAHLLDQKQVLSFNGAGLRSYGVDGQLLWLQPWVTQGDSRVNVAQPIVLDKGTSNSRSEDESKDLAQAARILISSGYDKGTALISVNRTQVGWTTELVWETNLLKSKLSNVVVFRNFAYGLDNGILACIDLENGSRKWKSGRYGHGKLLLVRDKLLIQAESGEIVLVEASPQSHLELGRFDALSSKTWNHLALAGSVLVVRNDREAAAFKLPTLATRLGY